MSALVPQTQNSVSMSVGGSVPWYLRCKVRPCSICGTRISHGRSVNITMWAPSLAAESTESSLEATA